MLIPDINLLLYAHHAGFTEHTAARKWWESLLNSGQRVAMPWMVVFGFLRISTSQKVFPNPPNANAVCSVIKDWFACSGVQPIDPGPQHFDIVSRLVAEVGAAAALTSDIHLAALALEYRCELYSNDRDFGIFKGLKWINPLA